jgi:sec-independent protein translocase protein TatA
MRMLALMRRAFGGERQVARRSPLGQGVDMHIGTGELLMLVIIVAIVFSASRMSALGNAVGKFVYSFRKASKGHDLVDVTPRHGSHAPAEKTVDADVTRR